MQHIELGEGHRLDGSLETDRGQEVPCGVDKQSPMRKARGVLNSEWNLVDGISVRGEVVLYQLRESFEAVQGTPDCLRRYCYLACSSKFTRSWSHYWYLHLHVCSACSRNKPSLLPVMRPMLP